MYGHFSALQIETKQQLTQHKRMRLYRPYDELGGEKNKFSSFRRKKNTFYIYIYAYARWDIVCVCQVGIHTHIVGLYYKVEGGMRGAPFSPRGTQIIDLYLCF